MEQLDQLPTESLIQRAAEAARRDPTGDADDRWGLVWALHHRCEDAVFEAAAAWCGSPEPVLRCLGADVLAQLGAGGEQPFAGVSVPLLVALLDDPEPTVLCAALFAFGHLGRVACGSICVLASHESASVRHAVAYCIGGREEELARATLVELSADADLSVRNWATFGLGTQSDVDSPAIRDALAARLGDEDHEVRGEAMLGLAVRGDARAVDAILGELALDDVSVLAIEAAAELPDGSFLPYLEALLEADPDDPGLGLAVARCRACGGGDR